MQTEIILLLQYKFFTEKIPYILLCSVNRIILFWIPTENFCPHGGIFIWNRKSFRETEYVLFLNQIFFTVQRSTHNWEYRGTLIQVPADAENRSFSKKRVAELLIVIKT